MLVFVTTALGMRVFSSTFAQLVQSSAICSDDFDWMQNAKSQSPCEVASYLDSACGDGDWLVPALELGHSYSPPNASTHSLCSCSWASYNLLSGCAACQGFESAVYYWDPWITDCGGFLTNSTYFPPSITLPNSTEVPFWATTSPSTWSNARFDVNQSYTLALEAGANDAHSPTSPSNSATPSAGRSSSSIGAIVGGVVGGIVFVLATLAGTVLAIIKFRRREQRMIIGRPTLHGRSSSEASSASILRSPVSISSQGSRAVHFMDPVDLQAQQPSHPRTLPVSPYLAGPLNNLAPTSMYAMAGIPRSSSTLSVYQNDASSRTSLNETEGIITPFILHPVSSSSHPITSPLSNGGFVPQPPVRRMQPPPYTRLPSDETVRVLPVSSDSGIGSSSKPTTSSPEKPRGPRPTSTRRVRQHR